MSPVQEACQQVARDERFQAFMDWARHANVRVLLYTVAELMKGQRDPFSVSPSVARRFDDLRSCVDGWSGVLEVLAQVQKEHEAAVRG